MSFKSYSLLTSVIFLLIGVLHLARIIQGWSAEIGGWLVPMWLSWVALILAGYLGYTGWKHSQR